MKNNVRPGSNTEQKPDGDYLKRNHFDRSRILMNETENEWPFHLWGIIKDKQINHQCFETVTKEDKPTLCTKVYSRKTGSRSKLKYHRTRVSSMAEENQTDLHYF